MITIEISPGEALDRVSILLIKQEKLQDPAKLEQVKSQLTPLWQEVARNIFVDTSEYIEKLKKVNTNIWELEDKLRHSADPEEAARYARKIQFNNDERFKLKLEIDTFFGSNIIEQKSFHNEFSQSDREEVRNTHGQSKYFGQWETDRIIEEYFPGKTNGVAIDVGAADGVKGSNTKYFEDMGWQVVCIEPNPAHKESLSINRHFYISPAISNYDGVGELEVFDIGERHINSSVTSLKADDRLVEDHKHLINDRYKIPIKVRKLETILNQYLNGTIFEGLKEVDFVSIDTEGTELDVLKGINFEELKIKLLVVENNYNDPEIEKYLKDFGYIKDKRYKINDFYIRADQ